MSATSSSELVASIIPVIIDSQRAYAEGRGFFRASLAEGHSLKDLEDRMMPFWITVRDADDDGGMELIGDWLDDLAGFCSSFRWLYEGIIPREELLGTILDNFDWLASEAQLRGALRVYLALGHDREELAAVIDTATDWTNNKAAAIANEGLRFLRTPDGKDGP